MKLALLFANYQFIYAYKYVDFARNYYYLLKYYFFNFMRCVFILLEHMSTN
jgi:hypothetical protein